MEICNACIARETNKQNFKKEQICKKCGKIFHSTFIMNIGPCCNPNIKGIANFIIKDNIKFYKNKPVETIIKKLNSGEYNVNDFPGWNKRFGQWYYKYENILTGEINKLNNSLFQTKNNVLYYYDRTVKDYIPWEEYKENFISMISSFNLDYHNIIGNIFPTFITKDSSINCGHSAFDQLLIDKNIDWFVYIKFFIKENEIYPLVVGKSGSYNVNSNGSDLSFSKNVDDGPSRKFLYENNLDYLYDYIYLIPCKTENEAYSLEKEICSKYNLFSS